MPTQRAFVYISALHLLRQGRLLVARQTAPTPSPVQTLFVPLKYAVDIPGKDSGQHSIKGDREHHNVLSYPPRPHTGRVL